MSTVSKIFFCFTRSVLYKMSDISIPLSLRSFPSIQAVLFTEIRLGRYILIHLANAFQRISCQFLVKIYICLRFLLVTFSSMFVACYFFVVARYLLLFTFRSLLFACYYLIISLDFSKRLCSLNFDKFQCGVIICAITRLIKHDHDKKPFFNSYTGFFRLNEICSFSQMFCISHIHVSEH